MGSLFAACRRCRILLTVGVVIFAHCASAADVVIHVAPDGSDDASGRNATVAGGGKAEGPLRTLAAAQSVVRSRLATMRGSKEYSTIRVRLATGVYALNAPLLFEPADSGFAGHPVVWEGAGEGLVTVSGGAELPLLSASADEQRFSPPVSSPELMRAAGQLYVNERRAVLARQPDAGNYWFVAKAVAVPGEKADEQGRTAFDPTPDAAAWLARLDETDRTRAVLNIAQSWSAGRHRFDPASAPGGAIRIAPRARWAFLQYGTSQRYFVENVAAAFDKPGEWFWDAAAVRYRPTSAEKGQSLRVVLPVLDRLLVIRGGGSSGQLVENLEFRGLRFANARWLTPPGGMFDLQAGVSVGAAIEVDGARGIVFDRCGVTRTGGFGIWLRNNVRDSTITRCVFDDLGGGAIKVAEAAPLAGSDRSATGANQISNNRISRTGEVVWGAAAVWVGHSFDNEIANNTIFDTSYTAISLGWTWGYAGPNAGRNRVVANLLYNIGRGQLADMGAIYTLGRQPGTVIAGNVIREVRSYAGYGPGAWGIYNDQGSSEIAVENNVVVGTDAGAYHMHMARNNVVRGNVFAGSDSAELAVNVNEPANPHLEVEGNWFLPRTKSWFTSYAPPPDVRFSRNMVSARESKGPIDLSRCGSGCREADFGLESAAPPRAVRLLSADAQAVAKVAAIVAEAGVRRDAGLSAAEVPVNLERPRARLAPPIPVAFDMASVELGGRPTGMEYLPRGNREAIAVSASPTAPGGRCLRFQDGPTFRNRFEPYSYVPLNHETGTTTVEFALVVDENSDFVHEWRDAGKPYLVGPSLRVSAQGVRVGGKLVAPVRPGAWMQFRLVAALGSAATSWRLEVQGPEGKPQIADKLPFVSPDWRALRWLGFISESAVTSSTCLTGLRVSSN